MLHTKIVCTIGPACREPAMLRQLIVAGMNVARLNFSHGDHASHLKVIKHLKGLSRKLNHPIAILLDLQGPEIRTGELPANLELQVGEMVWLTVRPEDDPEVKSVHVNYVHLVTDLKVGDRVTVDNGLINLEVLEIQKLRLRCRVIDGGQLGSRKHVNLPGIRVNLPSITEKDKRDILFGIEQEVDFIALSFVRSAGDVLEARALLEQANSHVQLVAKIENQEGVDQFGAILAVADGIMVARGDLGVEVDIEELPVIQRRIVKACAVAGKPVIVATHLLESMITHPLPTRAEVTDVANAVYEQADALMLSGETATGVDPVRCVEQFDSIMRRIEKEPGYGFFQARHTEGAREELARAACRLADSMGAQAILVITRRGLLAQSVASYRPQHAIIYAFTNMSRVRRRLWLLRSVVPFVIDLSESNPEATVQSALNKLRQRQRLLPGDPIVILSHVKAGRDTITSIQVRTFE